MTITELVEQAHVNAVEKGFWDNPRETGTLIALIHSEVTEALTAEDCAKFCEELADIIIRICDLAGGMGINLENVVDLAGLSRWEYHGAKGEVDCSSVAAIEASLNQFPQDMDKLTELKIPLSLELLGVFIKHIDRKNACHVHWALSWALEGDRQNSKSGFETGLAMAFLLTFHWAAQKGYSIEDAIKEKMAKNKERPRLHGKKY